MADSTNGTTLVGESKSLSEMAAMQAQMRAELDALRAENASLKSNVVAFRPKVYLKVSPKGGVSLYGLGKWPVTLYQEQWEEVKRQLPAIDAFVAEHKAELSVKGDPKRDVETTAPAATPAPANERRNGPVTVVPPVAGGAPTDKEKMNEILSKMTPEQAKVLAAMFG